MPSFRLLRLSWTLARPLSRNNLCEEVCAGGVSKHFLATCDPRALLFFTIPNFCTDGRAAIAADCKSDVSTDFGGSSPPPCIDILGV